MPSLGELVLASASPRRLELLRSLGLDVAVVPSGYDETDPPGLAPVALAALHARGKLDDVAARLDRQHDRRAIVASDTVVDLDGASLGKPAGAQDARRMLGLLSGREHTVHTAYALRLPGGPAETILEEVSSTRVRFHRLAPAEIAAYVETGEPADKAGAYGIQGRASTLVDSIRGDFYTVMGFPLGRFVRALAGLGFYLPS
ncbi:MAG: Maf family protein [Vulcanimicrobiaceae bacterium]